MYDYKFDTDASLHCSAFCPYTRFTFDSGADVLIGAGDYTTAGKGARQIIEIIAKENIPTFLDHGNHDNSSELGDFTEEWTNVHLLHGQLVEIEGVTFFELGGETPKLSDAKWNESVSEEDVADMLSLCPSRLVFVTHSQLLNL